MNACEGHGLCSAAPGPAAGAAHMTCLYVEWRGRAPLVSFHAVLLHKCCTRLLSHPLQISYISISSLCSAWYYFLTSVIATISLIRLIINTPCIVCSTVIIVTSLSNYGVEIECTIHFRDTFLPSLLFMKWYFMQTINVLARVSTSEDVNKCFCKALKRPFKALLMDS